ncbi:MAG: hypothetical protein J6I55_11610 [Ruminococcus sp.]|nr:hypothetical protein [Ruminococcus sp.]
MSVENLQTLSFYLLIASGVTFLISVVLFFAFRVPKIFSELTGIAERKGIAAIQKRSERGETGNVNEHFSVSEQLAVQHDNTQRPAVSDSEKSSPGTVKLATRRLTDSHDIDFAGTSFAVDSDSDDSNVLPVLSTDTEFVILEEMSFTGSTEVIE